MQLSLTRQKALLVSLNPRAERHGETRVPAADLGLMFDAPNDILSLFDPALKSSLYRAPDDSQGELDVSTPGYLPKLRFPRMGGVKWEIEIDGGKVTVHYGTDTDRSNIILEDELRIDGFRFDPKEGGTVAVHLRVACKPTPEQIAKLYGLIQQQIEVSIEPPKADEGQSQGSITT